MIINFDKNSGGGGGGSYTLPIASANVLGGVKIGSGVTIDASGAISVSGGGAGESNYVIVDALSAITNPTEGLMAWVNTSSSVTENIKVYIADKENWTGSWDGERPEGYVAYLSTDPENHDYACSIYISGDYYYWSFENDGQWHNGEWEGHTFEYRTHNVNSTGDAWIEFRSIGDLYLVLEGGAAGGTVEEVRYTGGDVWAYRNGEWIKPFDYVYDWVEIEPSSSAETAAFIVEVNNAVAGGVYPSIKFEDSFLKFENGNPSGVTFFGVRDNNVKTRIYFSNTTFDDNGFDSRGIRIDHGAYVDVSISAYNYLAVDYTGHLSGDYSCISYGAGEIYRIWFKIGGEQEDLIAPLKWRHNYTTDLGDGDFRNVWVIGADIPFRTENGIELWSGVWAVLDGDWYEDNAHTLSWTKIAGPFEDSNYPVYVPSE